MFRMDVCAAERRRWEHSDVLSLSVFVPITQHNNEGNGRNGSPILPRTSGTEDTTTPRSQSDAEERKRQREKERNANMCRALKNLDLTAVQNLLKDDKDGEQSIACRILDADNKMTALDIICGKYYKNNNVDATTNIFKEIWRIIKEKEQKDCVLKRFNMKGYSLLYQAIDNGYRDIIYDLVIDGADLRDLHRSLAGITALHAATKRPRILKYLLETLETIISRDLSESRDYAGDAPIHYAAMEIEVESMKLLVDKFGIQQLTLCNRKKCSPLHTAAKYGSVKIVDYILQYEPTTQVYRKTQSVPAPEKVIQCDDDNETGTRINHVQTHPSCTVYLPLELTLKSKNKLGETPLFISTAEGHKGVTALLLRHGAVLSEMVDGITSLENISRTFEEPSKFLNDVFDYSITKNKDRNIFSVDYTKVLTDDNSKSLSQIKIIKDMMKLGLNDLLTHPLVNSLIYLKWICLLRYFHMVFIIFGLFFISFNSYVVMKFYIIDSRNTTVTSESSNCFVNWYDWLALIIITMPYMVLVIQEVITVKLLGFRYFQYVESWVKLCLYISTLFMQPMLAYPCKVPSDWERHVSCVVIMMSWIQCLYMFSRLRDTYTILMFNTVAWNMIKMLLKTIGLVIGFSWCFMIEYRSKHPFEDPFLAVLKTIVMMSSEFDYENLFEVYNNELQDSYNIHIVRLLALIFVIFICIILMNFLVAVAVKDANELKVIGKIKRTERQVEILNTFEVFGDSLLVKAYPILSRLRFHKGMSYSSQIILDYPDIKILQNLGKWDVTLKYENLYYYQRIPLKLHNAIIRIAHKNIYREKEQSEANEQKRKVDRIYNAIVRMAPRNLEKSVQQQINEIKNDVNKILRILNNDNMTEGHRGRRPN